MKYDVIARTKEGYLAYEFRITLDEIPNHKLYQQLIKDAKYIVKLVPANA
jgi:hypothetical protein